MKRFLSVAAAVMLSIPAFCAVEFANFQEFYKAYVAASNKNDYAKICELVSAWRPKIASEYEAMVCFYAENRALRMMKKYDEAAKVADNFLAGKISEKNTTFAYYIKGITLDVKEDYPGAAECFEKAFANYKLLSESDCKRTTFKLSFLYWKTQQADKCLELLNKIVADPKLGDVEAAYYYTTIVLCDTQKHEECEKIAKQAMQTVKKPIYLCGIYYAYASVMFNKENDEEAEKYFKECIKADPKNWRVKPAQEKLKELQE